MAGVGKVLKACVEKGRCTDESCEHPWYLEYWRFNKRYRKSIAALYGVDVTSKREAEKVWLPKFVSEVNAAIDQKRIPFRDREAALASNARIVGMTFETFVHDVYMPGYYECELSDPAFKKRHLTAFYQIQGFLTRFGAVALLDFNDALIRAYKQELKTTVATQSGEPLQAASYNKILGKLRQIMRWGHSHEKVYFPRVPFGGAGVRLDLDAERPRERRLYTDPDEERLLIDAARRMHGPEHDHVGGMMELRIVAAIDLCARRGELLRIKRSDIDFTTEVVTLPRFSIDHHGEEVRGTKNGEMRELVITDRLMKMLQPRKALPPHAFVFGKINGDALAPASLRKPWATLKLMAYGHKPGWTEQGGLDAPSRQRLQEINLHWHDLRHEGASRYGESGEFKPKALMVFLGHKELETTMRYVQLSDTAIRDAVKAAGRAQDAKRAAREKAEAKPRRFRLV